MELRRLRCTGGAHYDTGRIRLRHFTWRTDGSRVAHRIFSTVLDGGPLDVARLRRRSGDPGRPQRNDIEIAALICRPTAAARADRAGRERCARAPGPGAAHGRGAAPCRQAGRLSEDSADGPRHGLLDTPDDHTATG